MIPKSSDVQADEYLIAALASAGPEAVPYVYAAAALMHAVFALRDEIRSRT